MPTTILVVGHANIETTLKLHEDFPVHYQPVRYPFYGIRTTVSGAGYNIARALTTVGHTVRFASLIGQDEAGDWVRKTLTEKGISTEGVLPQLDETANAAILYDESGRRAVFTDLKSTQDTLYPASMIEKWLDGVEMAVLTNINFSRPALAAAQARGIPIATDVHTIHDLHDAYNRDYMAAAHILFMSHEKLPEPSADWARRVRQTYQTPIVVIGMGSDGALLSTEDGEQHVPGVTTRPVVNTIGAGDSLFSAFVSGYVSGASPREALQRAVIFASWKVGASAGADGFLARDEWERLIDAQR